MTEPLTTDYLVTFAREQQAAAQRVHGTRAVAPCPSCACGFHGLPCSTRPGSTCPCPSSFRETA